MSLALLNVAIVWTIAVVTPGPNFFIVLQTAICKSRRHAFAVVLGVGCGTVMWALLAFLGLNVLLQAVPRIYTTSKLLGGIYLVYLGLRFITSKSKGLAGVCEGFPSSASLAKDFQLGLLTNLSNPKAAAFVTSLFALTMPGNVDWYTGFTSMAVMMLISMSWYTLVAYLFSMKQLRYFYQQTISWVERIGGIIFIGFGVSLCASSK